MTILRHATVQGIAASLDRQADVCAELHSPMYAGLMAAAARDVACGGPLRRMLTGHAHRSALGLRLAAAVHRLILDAAPSHPLRAYYPSVGGTWDLTAAWPLFLDTVGEHEAHIHAALESPPQTNEAGRSAALLGGLLHLTERFGLPIRLTELGASAGVNLRVDHYRFEFSDGHGYGPRSASLVMHAAWNSSEGFRPGLPLQLIDRAGCDPRPVDAATTRGRHHLASFVWPDQPHRLGRLRAACAVAAQLPVPVLAVPAHRFVQSLAPEPGVTTVVWHSAIKEHLPAAAWTQVEHAISNLGERATPLAPVAHLMCEPLHGGPQPSYHITLRLWPGATVQVLGQAPEHGLPVAWSLPAARPATTRHPTAAPGHDNGHIPPGPLPCTSPRRYMSGP